MLFPSGNPFQCQEEVLYLQPLIPPKRFDISPPVYAFWFSVKQCERARKHTHEHTEWLGWRGRIGRLYAI